MGRDDAFSLTTFSLNTFSMEMCSTSSVKSKKRNQNGVSTVKTRNTCRICNDDIEARFHQLIPTNNRMRHRAFRREKLIIKPTMTQPVPTCQDIHK